MGEISFDGRGQWVTTTRVIYVSRSVVYLVRDEHRGFQRPPGERGEIYYTTVITAVYTI